MSLKAYSLPEIVSDISKSTNSLNLYNTLEVRNTMSMFPGVKTNLRLHISSIPRNGFFQ